MRILTLKHNLKNMFSFHYIIQTYIYSFNTYITLSLYFYIIHGSDLVDIPLAWAWRIRDSRMDKPNYTPLLSCEFLWIPWSTYHRTLKTYLEDCKEMIPSALTWVIFSKKQNKRRPPRTLGSPWTPFWDSCMHDPLFCTTMLHLQAYLVFVISRAY